MSQVSFQIPGEQWVSIAGEEIFQVSRGQDQLSFVSLGEGTAEVRCPTKWRAIDVDGTRVPLDDGIASITLPGPVHAVGDLQMSIDGMAWRVFEPTAIENGELFLRFRLPEARGAETSLILAGLAAQKVHFKWADGMQTIDAHPYREVVVDVSERRGWVELRVVRRRPHYLRSRNSPDGRAIPIRVAAPYLFAPKQMVVKCAE